MCSLILFFDSVVNSSRPTSYSGVHKSCITKFSIIHLKMLIFNATTHAALNELIVIALRLNRDDIDGS